MADFFASTGVSNVESHIERHIFYSRFADRPDEKIIRQRSDAASKVEKRSIICFQNTRTRIHS
jgi:hypothetical protein